MFEMCHKAGLTKMIPVLLHVLDLQLIPALCEDGFGVLLEASRENTTLPGSNIDPPIHIHHHYTESHLVHSVQPPHLPSHPYSCYYAMLHTELKNVARIV